MKNKIIFLFLLFSLNLYSDDIILSKELLVENDFNISATFVNIDLVFYQDNTYEYDHSEEGIFLYITGTYEIIENKAYLTPAEIFDGKGGPNIPFKSIFGSGECYIEENDLIVGYPYSLVYKFFETDDQNNPKTYQISFVIKSISPNTGKEVIFNDISVVIMGCVNGVISKGLTLRELPDVNSKIIQNRYNIYEEPVDFFNAGTEVLIYARTKDMDTVGEWKNYWYYVKVDKQGFGWMFSEFIDITE
jgi:hypothetical protein